LKRCRSSLIGPRGNRRPVPSSTSPIAVSTLPRLRGAAASYKWRVLETLDRLPGRFGAANRSRRAGNGSGPRQCRSILVVDDRVPEFDKHAGALTIFQYLELMVNEGMSVSFLPHDLQPRQPYTRLLQQIGIEVLYSPIDVRRWLATNADRLDCVLLARPSVAPGYIGLVRRHTNARILYYTHDLHYLRERRRYETTGDPRALAMSRRLEQLERTIFRKVDCVLTPSAAELELIHELAPTTEAAILTPYIYEPVGVDAGVASARPYDIVFLGGFTHPPNVDAARWLVQDIMPDVWSVLPGVKVAIVGSNPTHELFRLAGPNVAITGYVPDVTPYLAGARVSVNPLRFGAGVKGKIIASLNAGVPVITTRIGNEGIGLAAGESVLIGESSTEIASAIVRVLQDDDLARRLGDAGRRFVAENFSPAVARKSLFAALLIDSDPSESR
jgi:glycosyltransferase involved in cell wall biosynthesis